MSFVVIAEWDVSSHEVIERLRDWAKNIAAEYYVGYRGVYLKTWFSNPEHNVWGAVYLVHDPHALDDDRLPRTFGGATGPLGRAPDRVRWNLAELSVLGGEPLADVLFGE